MNANELIKQTAQAAEEYLIGWLKSDDKPIHDFKTLAGHTSIDDWEPGELVVDILDACIKKYGAEISDDMNCDIFDDKLKAGNLDALWRFIDDMGDGELILLDQVLWLEMGKIKKPIKMPQKERKAWQHSVLDKSQTARFKKLGDLGEYIAKAQLQQRGFKQVKNLNTLKYNNIFADISAVRDEIKYIFSVKTRNKFENNGSLNSRYKLGAKCYEYATLAEKEHDAQAAWIAIAIDIDEGSFDAYWGLLDDLKGNTGILMSLKATENYNCLTRDSRVNEYVDFDCKILKNKYKTRK